MKLLDSKGRLFGKVSLLDVGALLVIVMVFVGIFLFPGTSGSVAQINTMTKPVEVSVIVRGLSVLDPEGFLQNLRDVGKTNIIIRNQPSGQVNVKTVERLPRMLAIPQPDGSVKELPDPRAEELYSINMMLTLGGDAQITDNGVVLGGSKLKIGTPIELEGKNYNFNGSVIEVNTL
ncbi:pyruvate/2-oxoglutarate dehydrogenase complex,dihydrolipoamide dehydrogenase (E3) component [Leptolyngbya valderiana BDU 20041]|nr:pyruvate/2-oxoglutarate dehydrogenase complex,dihydrolipoamide dehydrogenase (E3) component [Leptolyngbya valderiana BDU 20041]